MPSFTVYKGHESGKVVKSESSREVKDDEVFLRITASGLCGTELQYYKTDMALGHEGVGVVEILGPAVKHLKEGDRVGWGYEHNSCGDCEQCLKGSEQYCSERALYGFADLDQGSFGTGAVWREKFLFKIPDGLSDIDAAPLMCGGATVFNALHTYNIQPTETVGVLGFGGLGHLAVQFAAAMGCNVVVLSGSDRKRDVAMKLGAKEYIATKDKKELKLEQPLNRLLVTSSAHVDWSLILPILAPEATIHPIGIFDGNIEIPYMPFLVNGTNVQGSVVASRYVHRRMLAFAESHDVKPITEQFPMSVDGINEAIERLQKGDINLRGVFVN